MVMAPALGGFFQVQRPAGTGIGDGAVRPLHLKKSGATDGHIVLIVRLVERTLGHDHLGGHRLGSQADLQPRRDRGLALRRPWGDQVLVNHVLKLKAQLAKARGGGVGQIVGDGVQVHLLRAHAAGCRVQCSNHFFSLAWENFPGSTLKSWADPRWRTC
jgi:hypothetical protein